LISLYDPEMEAALAEFIGQLEADPDARVVVFDSALPDFFMAHLNPGLTLVHAMRDGGSG